MVLKDDGIKIVMNRNLELLLGIMVAYIEKNPDMIKNFDFIEIPDISYVKDICKVNKINKCSLTLDFLLNISNYRTIVYFACFLDDNYDMDFDRFNYSYFSSSDYSKDYLVSVALDLKKYAKSIKWNEFFDSNYEYYKKLYSFIKIPDKFDITDINRFYDDYSYSYTCFPSVFLNVGFSFIDKKNSFYYFRGFTFNEKTKVFNYYGSYFTECLFYEFSVPIVRKLVERYYSSINDIDTLYNAVISNGLPVSYEDKKGMLCEYVSRTNSFILNAKYYKNLEVEDSVYFLGFDRIENMISFSKRRIKKFSNYEEFFKYDMVNYINNMR